MNRPLPDPPSQQRRKRFEIEPVAPGSVRATHSGKKFQIDRVIEGYRPGEQRIPRNLCLTDGILSEGRGASRTSLTFRPEATQRLFEHTGWGMRTRGNVVEQGGLLLGRVHHDTERGQTWGIVEEVVHGHRARGSTTYLELGTKVWKRMLDEFDVRVEKEQRDLHVIGWYHTHPNGLDVFMSGTDRATQRRFFASDWQFAVVLNPHRQVFKVFHGADAAECQGNLLVPAIEAVPVHVAKQDVPPPEEESPVEIGPGLPPLSEPRRTRWWQQPIAAIPAWAFTTLIVLLLSLLLAREISRPGKQLHPPPPAGDVAAAPAGGLTAAEGKGAVATTPLPAPTTSIPDHLTLIRDHWNPGQPVLELDLIDGDSIKVLADDGSGLEPIEVTLRGWRRKEAGVEAPSAPGSGSGASPQTRPASPGEPR